MPSNLKFPPSAEIKRVIAIAIGAGVEIGSLEIYPDKIIIYRREKNEPAITDYDLWKMAQGEDTERLRHSDDDTDALVGKPRG